MELVLDTNRLDVGDAGVKEFFWPLGRKEQQAQRDTTLEQLAALIRSGLRSEDEDCRILGMCFHWLLAESIAMYRATALARRANEAGVPIKPQEGGRLQASVMAGLVPDVTRSRFAQMLRSGPQGHRKFLRPLVKLRRSLDWNGPSVRSFLPVNTYREIVACHRTPLLDRHARLESRYVKQTLFDEWFDPVLEEPQAPAINSALIDACVASIERGYMAGGEQLPVSQAEYFRSFLKFVTRYVRHHYLPLMSHRRALPKTLWTGTGGYIYARMLRNAVQAGGGYVVGHEHGAGEAHIAYFSAKTLIEYESADEFVTYCWEGADALANTFNPSWHVHDRRPRIVSIGERDNTKAPSCPARWIQPNKIKRVMYPTTALLGERVTLDHFVGDYVYVDWAARLVSRLGQHRYRVIHKPHPGGDNRFPSGFARRLGAVQSNKPFEQALGEADAFVLDFARSTTFPVALATNKPIVYIDFGLERWHPQARALLERRVRVVKGWIDDHNRFQVDWDDLANAMSDACELTDRSIVHHYYRDIRIGA